MRGSSCHRSNEQARQELGDKGKNDSMRVIGGKQKYEIEDG